MLLASAAYVHDFLLNRREKCVVTIPGFSLVFSTTGKGPVQTGKAIG